MLGKMFRVSYFGESHGRGIGVLIEGCPPGIKIDTKYILNELAKRWINDPNISTQRREKDEFEILSGVFNGYTTGAPLSIFIFNKDIYSKNYDEIRFKPRPSHADYTAYRKYHGYNDYRGGGIFSGRITAAMVAGGAIAKQLIKKYQMEVYAYIYSVGNIAINESVELRMIKEYTYKSPVRCPDPNKSKEIYELVKRVRERGDSVGGIVETIAVNMPVGLGDPPIDTLDGDIAKAIFTIPGVKGIEFGEGFKLTKMMGSEANDPFAYKGKEVVTESNKSGGINGGISNGMPLIFRVAFKPTPSIYIPQKTVDMERKTDTTIELRGRFDPCIAIRAPPIVESVTAIVLADHLLRWLAWEKYLEGI